MCQARIYTQVLGKSADWDQECPGHSQALNEAQRGCSEERRV